MSKKSFFIGTLILTSAGVISRFAGFFYRIFLSHTLGAAGLGIFQLTIPVQSLLLAISVGGIQTAISTLSASSFALKKSDAAKDYFVTGAFLSAILSLFFAFILYQNADFIASDLLLEEKTLPLIQLLAFTLPLCALHTCINSYYFGQKKTMIPSAIQLLEQISRILATYAVFLYLTFNHKPVTPQIAGIGALFSEIVAVFTGLLTLTSHLKNSHLPIFHIDEFLYKCKTIAQFAFPLTLNRILLTLLGSIEVILIPKQLSLTGINNTQALSIYGILSGMALPIILFPATFTNSIAIMLMPSVAELKTLEKHVQLRGIIMNAYKYIFTLGIIFTVIFFFGGNLAGNLLFHNATAGIYISTLSFVCPCLYLNTTLSSILHGLGKVSISLLYNAISICIRIFFVIYMIPRTGIQGYLYGVILSEYLKTFLCTLSLYHFKSTK